MEVSKYLDITKRVLVDLPIYYESLGDELSKADRETSDLLHILELGKLDAVNLVKISLELKEVRQRRRKIKDELDLLRETTSYVRGIVSVDELVEKMNNFNKEKTSVEDVFLAVKACPKQRFEIVNGMIRARYGHSLESKITREIKRPPKYLYHGTAPSNLLNINKQGLLKGSRQSVHLTDNMTEASNVGSRKCKIPLIIVIHAEQAYLDGLPFYEESSGIWLSDNIPAKYVVGN